MTHFQAGGDQPGGVTFGLVEIDREAGTAVQECRPELLDDDGSLPVGALCVLADHVLASRISSRIGAEDRFVTSHLHLEVLRSPPPGLDRVAGRNTELHLLGGSAFSAGVLTTTGGETLARVSARFAVLAGGQAAGGAVVAAEEPGADEPGAGPLHPWTAAPLHRLLDSRLEQLGEGRVALTIAATPPLANERFGLHGGVGAAVGERTGRLALRSALGPEATGVRTVELRVVFLRPVPATGGRLAADGEVVFRGRTTATTTARLRRADGRIAVQVDAVHTVAGD